MGFPAPRVARVLWIGVAAALLAPGLAPADDSKLEGINPAAPYRLHVSAMPGGQTGVDKILDLFAPKNAGKDWRRTYDLWFTIASSPKDAEMTIIVEKANVSLKPGYEPLYYIEGTVRLAPMASPHRIVGYDPKKPLFGGSTEARHFLDLVIAYMRADHKDAVLAHADSPPPVETEPAAAASAEPEPEPEPAAPFTVYVTTLPAPAGARVPKSILDAVSDVRKQLPKAGDGVRPAESEADAEVLIQIVTRATGMGAAPKIEGRLTVFDRVDGIPIVGQGASWKDAAADMVGRMATYLGLVEKELRAARKTSAPRPAAVLLVRRGDELLDAGDADGALAAWDEALGLAPKYGGALRRRGQLRLSRKEHEAALRDLDEAIALDRADPEACLARARAHGALGHAAEVQADLDVVARHLPRRPPLTGFPADQAASRTAAEVSERGAELEREYDELDQQTPLLSSEALVRKRQALDERRQEQRLLAAVVAGCEAGDSAVCSMLSRRLETGSARLPEPKRDPDDPGVDTATVTAATANLRAAAKADASVVQKLVRGDLLVLLEREPQDGWHHAIHVQTASEGWIKSSLVKPKLTKATRPQNPFEARRLDGQSPPKVTVFNDSDKDMTLTVGGRRHTILRRSQLTVNLPPGQHSYVGAAPGVIPAVGTDKWEVGYEYTWRFSIVKRSGATR